MNKSRLQECLVRNNSLASQLYLEFESYTALVIMILQYNHAWNDTTTCTLYTAQCNACMKPVMIPCMIPVIIMDARMHL